MHTVIVGCGDIGRRIALSLFEDGFRKDSVLGLVNTQASEQLCAQAGIPSQRFDLDQGEFDTASLQDTNCFYTVAPQKYGHEDLRSARLLDCLQRRSHIPRKVVLLSTTGVYGDHSGAWVDENCTPAPKTDRGQRRLHSEQSWIRFGLQNFIPIIVLRVPGIYSFSRLPRARIANRTPVVRAAECGFSNRVHADDLAGMALASMQQIEQSEVINASDGRPGKISEYLQAAAAVLGEAPLPEISMHEAQSTLSAGMLSYLSESRKISNSKMLELLNYELKYHDFREGIKYG